MNNRIKVHIVLGDEWIAEMAEVIFPIALLTLYKNKEKKLIRLDLDKKIFIDQPPSASVHKCAGEAARVVSERFRHKSFPGTQST